MNTWRRMKELDETVETEPTAAAVAELAELRIRNLKCFDELQSFNDNGKWLNLHPLLQGKSEIAELRSLLQHDPDEFLRLQRCCADSVRRYQSYLKRKDRRSYRQSDREALARYRDRLRLFTTILKSFAEQKDK